MANDNNLPDPKRDSAATGWFVCIVVVILLLAAAYVAYSTLPGH